MPSVSVVELTNTFDDWRNRTNDVITEINGANSVDPTSAIVYANSTSGFQVNEVVSDSLTGTAISGTRLIFTGGNINFTSANTTSLGNVHQTHILGGTAIDVSIPENADTSISNTFVYNSKINLNGQKFVSGAANINFQGATISNLGAVKKFTSEALEDDDVVLTNPTINVHSDTVGGLTISAGVHEFGGATVNGASMNTITMSGSTVQGGNVVVNGAGFLVTTNSVALAVDGDADANVAIGKFPEISTDIGTTKNPSSSKSRLHVRTDFAAGGTTATAVESVADELILENISDGGMTILTGATKNNHIAFGNSGDPDVGGIIYDHDTEDMHFVTDSANTVIFSHSFGGSVQIVGGDTVGIPSGKLHVNVGSTDGAAGLLIDSNDADQYGIFISASQTTQHVMEIDTSTLSTGSAIFIDDNSAESGPRKILHIDQSHADAGGTGFHIETSGMKAVDIVQNTLDQVALNVSASGIQTEPLVSFINSGDADDMTLYIKNQRTDGGLIAEIANNSSSGVFAVSANGNIGVNDSTPTKKLDVVGDIRATTDMFVGSSIIHDGDTDTFISFGEDTITFKSANESKIYIDASAVTLYHDNNPKLATTSTGVSVTGNMTLTGTSVCAGGIQCAVRVEDTNGTLLNSC